MFKQRVQGFAVGAAAVAAIMVGLPFINGTSPTPELDAFAETLDIDIAWTAVNPCTPMDVRVKACFAEWTPNTIYVNPNRSPELVKYSVLHETAHVLQHRLGEDLDDCRADQIAQLLGAEEGPTWCHWG